MEDDCIRTRETFVRSPLGHDIFVLVESPGAAPARLPTVILIGGAGPDSHDAFTVTSEKGTNHAFRELGASLMRAGFTVVRFDEMGVGRSTGDYAAHATTRTLAEDVAAIVRALHVHESVDSAAIFLLGFSEGASIALLVASSEPRIAGVISMGGPAWIGRRVVESQQALWLSHSGPVGSARRERYMAELEREHLTRSANDTWYRYFLEYDPLVAAARVTAPTLLLQAGFDAYVLPVQAEELRGVIASAGNMNVTLRYFEQLEHTMAGGSSLLAPIARPVVDTIISWSGRQLGALLAPRSCRSSNGPLSATHR